MSSESMTMVASWSHYITFDCEAVHTWDSLPRYKQNSNIKTPP